MLADFSRFEPRTDMSTSTLHRTLTTLVLSLAIASSLGGAACATDTYPSGSADTGGDERSDADARSSDPEDTTTSPDDADTPPTDGASSPEDVGDDGGARDGGRTPDTGEDAGPDPGADASRDASADGSPSDDTSDVTPVPSDADAAGRDARSLDGGGDATMDTGSETGTFDTGPTRDTSPGTWRPLQSDSNRLATGAEHTCAIWKQGDVYCWGDDGYGQLGLGGTNGATKPKRVSLSGTPVEIDAGEYLTCARRTNGTISCWGHNDEGQVGNGRTNSSGESTPNRVQQISNADDICAESKHACAVDTSGSVYCWGQNSKGQLGADPNPFPRSTSPMKVPGIADARRVTCGEEFVCALRSGGDVSCWGYNNKGQLGDGSTTNRSQPVAPQVPNSVQFVDLAGGVEHACGLDQSGRLWCWGNDEDGQLGLGSGDQTTSTPQQVKTLSQTPLEVVAGGGFTCVRTANGPRCWGSDSFGQLGNGSGGDTPTPVPVQGVAASTGIEAGELHTCVLSSGSMYCWGFNSGGQLGNGSTGVSQTSVRVQF